jgi:predicted NACHT family NTPase
MSSITIVGDQDPSRGIFSTNLTTKTFTTNTISASTWEPHGKMSASSITVDGDILLNGISLQDTLKKIEERLGILHPNPKLESKWKLLKDLGDQYREIEKDLLDKEKMWELLKK